MDRVKNWWKLKKRSLFNNYYIYVDIADYFADDIFIQHQIRVDFPREMESDELPFQFIICRTNKKNAAEFELAMQELKNKMLLCGYTNYLQFCDEFGYVMDNGVAKEGGTYFGTAREGGEAD